jgi:hypothetical protein
MENLEIIYGILVGLSTEAIKRVIDSSGEIKDKLSSLLKLDTRSKLKVNLSEFNLNTRMTLNDNNEYVFRS